MVIIIGAKVVYIYNSTFLIRIKHFSKLVIRSNRWLYEKKYKEIYQMYKKQTELVRTSYINLISQQQTMKSSKIRSITY